MDKVRRLIAACKATLFIDRDRSQTDAKKRLYGILRLRFSDSSQCLAILSLSGTGSCFSRRGGGGVAPCPECVASESWLMFGLTGV